MSRELKNVICRSEFLKILAWPLIYNIIIVLLYIIEKTELSIVIYVAPFNIICFIIFLSNKKNQTKFLNSLTKEQIEQLEYEIKNPHIYHKYHYMLTNKYIIKLCYPYALIKYDDVLIVYEGPITYGKNRRYKRIILVTKTDKHSFLIGYFTFNANHNIEAFFETVKRANPSVLVDNTSENIKKIKNEYGIDIDKKSLF